MTFNPFWPIFAPPKAKNPAVRRPDRQETKLVDGEGSGADWLDPQGGVPSGISDALPRGTGLGVGTLQAAACHQTPRAPP